MPFFLHLFSFIQYIIEHGRIVSHTTLRLWQDDVLNVFSGFLGFTSHSCDDAVSMELVGLQSVAEIFGLPLHLEHEPATHTSRGSNRAVSEWKPTYLRQSIILAVYIF